MRRLWILAGLLILGMPAPAAAQLFFGSRPDPGFTIGPLIVRASVTPRLGAVPVSVLFSLVLPPTASPTAFAQDLYLLWPGEVQGEGRAAEDPALVRYVETLGFSVIAEGRLPLHAQSLYDTGGEPRTERAATVPFVTFVQAGGAFGLSPPATYIRIPWTSRLADRGWLMELRLRAPGLIKPKRAGWLENFVRGRRHVFSMTYNEVRDRPLFPVYAALRDRVVHLAAAPSELIVSFSDSERLKIEEVFPPASIRRLSEIQDSTELVSVFLEKSEGITPQQLSVHFGYFSRAQAVAVIVIPLLLLALGHAIGPVLGRSALWAGRRAVARLHLGRRGAATGRDSGVILPREVLDKLVPGATTHAEVLALCGEAVEEHAHLAVPGRLTLTYRGRRLHPRGRRVLGWLTAIRHWDLEEHEVRIELDGDVVRDVQPAVRRSRLAAAE